MADQLNTNNISGFKDKRIDEICKEYDVTFDVKKRTALLQELDGILTSQYHYVMEWYPPSERFAYWNKFGHATGYDFNDRGVLRIARARHPAALVDRSAKGSKAPAGDAGSVNQNGDPSR